MNTIYSEIIEFDDYKATATLMSYVNTYAKIITDFLNVNIYVNGTTITIEGRINDVKLTIKILQNAYQDIQLESNIDLRDYIRKYSIAYKEKSLKNSSFHPIELINGPSEILEDKSFKVKNKTITGKSNNQNHLISNLMSKDIVFSVGPAGTGKTFLAVAYGVHLFLKGVVEKIVITRPVVEAGENLGFLPGTLKEKIDPYLRPIYDILDELLGQEKMEQLIKMGKIEIAPIAYMRGRTLKKSYIIIDEAQNTTSMQMKMLLTRIADNSLMVVTGDLYQIDLPKKTESGLHDAINKLHKIDDIGFSKFTSIDVIRHPLVEKIINAYEEK